jgi:serine/threonine-protein kinase
VPDASDAAGWARVNDVFHRALELPAAERIDFVRRECSGSDSVIVEVLSLLAAHDRAADFLTSPAGDSRDRTALARVGKQIGQYRIERILGEGGMGVVYLAQDLKLQRPVALKAVTPELAANAAGRDRLRKEALAAAFTHPGIATVYTFEEIGDDAFIVSEYVDGETLREEMNRGPLGPKRVRAAAIELANALGAAHARGIVHRDLKPENVIRSTEGVLKILDFGLARVRDVPPELAQLSNDERTFGTPGYMSPEQIRRAPIDGRSDLFALGILMSEMMTGIHPFAATDSAATIARILEAEPSVVTVSRWTDTENAVMYDGLVRIVRALMQKDPAERFASAGALVDALTQLGGGTASGAIPQPQARWTAQRRWWRMHQGITAVAYTVLLGATALAADTLESRPLRMALFLAALAPAVGAVAIRLHLWFEAASRPQHWHVQYSRSWRWLRLCDVAFIGVMTTTAFVIDSTHNVFATVLVAGAVIALVSATLIEPATTRAAFDQP